MALEKRFRAGLADQAATRDVARQIVGLRTALTSYELRHEVRDVHDQQATPRGGNHRRGDVDTTLIRHTVMKERSASGGTGNLVVTRRPGRSVMIGDDIEVIVLRVEGDKVKLGISAPPSVKVLRRELWERQR